MRAKTPTLKRGVAPAILPEIRSLIETSRNYAVTTANLALVNRNWQIGRVLTEDLQRNARRAGYGQQLFERLADSLTRDYGSGFTLSNLNDMRRFFEQFEILQAVPVKSLTRRILQAVPVESETIPCEYIPPAQSSKRIPVNFAKHSFLGWTHYRTLLGLEPGLKQRFYFDQTAGQRWSTRELERRIEGALFERVGLSRDTRKLATWEKIKSPRKTPHFAQIFKDPYLLDFLGLKGAYSEKDLEASLIRNLEEFLAELGNEFCFIRRQHPMRVDDVDHWLDLLFYHRGLRCLVAIDLKLGAFTAADKGQMDLYLAWLKQHEWRKGENEPVGLVLCTSKRRQHVELLLRHGPHKLAVSEYRTRLPDKKLLEERLRIYSRLLSDDGTHAPQKSAQR